MDVGVAGVVLYDPNPTNPYGVELAGVLAQLGPVVLHCATEFFAGDPRIERRRTLMTTLHEAGFLRGLWQCVVGPAGAAREAALTNRVLVVVWIRHALDAAILLLAAWLGTRLVVINHNPTDIRPRTGVSGWLQRCLVRRAEVSVVHGRELLEAGRRDNERVAVAAHPPYDGWLATYGRARLQSPPPPLRVLFLGAMRADKGVADLPGILRQATLLTKVELLLAGSGELGPSIEGGIADAGVRIRRFGGTTGATDEELAEALAQANVMCAPYVGATQSGSAILALCAGVPVVGYDTGCLSSLLPQSWLVAPGDSAALGRLLAQFPLESGLAGELVRRLRDECRSDWRALLRESA